MQPDSPDIISIEAPVPPDSPPSITVERRRPGRREYDSPELVALMRGDAIKNQLAHADPLTQDDDDPLAPARGILFGLMLVIPFWALVGLRVWWMTR